MQRCNKCGQINLTNASACSQCGEPLGKKPATEELKSFAGQKPAEDKGKFEYVNFLAEEKETEKNGMADCKIYNQAVADNNEKQIKSVPEKIFIQDLSEKKVVGNVSFEDEFDMCDMPPVTYADNARIIPQEDKTALRNTALLAVVLAILIDAILVICLLTYFKGFAEKIVDVDYNISGKTGSAISDDYVYVNGKHIML